MAMTLITTNTSDGSASSDFTSSIDSTYKLYIFKMYNVNPATDSTHLKFQANAASQSGYNETITSTLFWAYHKEDDSGTPNIAYVAGYDQAQGTSYHILSDGIGNDSDASLAGELYLFNPSNTTYVKHFYATTQIYGSGDQAVNTYSAGYFNTTAAIDDIQFKMDSGNMDSVIKMYGVG